jgi:histidyl-tRNA synthetase
MKIQSVKGTRDFYPEQMRLRNWIVDAWRRVSVRNGFEEYDSPIFEYLDLFTAKSGEEIAEQLFHFTDRGDRALAIRPEITPSLARMVNARISSLPKPIKWFSVPRLCRAENPQKGRLREFFQWNIDVIGCDDVQADAECIFVCVDLLRELGLTSQDVQVRIGSRPLTIAALTASGVAPDRVEEVLPVLDKRPKVSQEEFEALCRDKGLDESQISRICAFQDCETLEALAGQIGDAEALQEDMDKLRQLWQYLQSMGIDDYCTLDMRIVRGLAYYTGIVYEVFDAGAALRAVAGGGRYDQLLEVLGGPSLGATGFGMGDVVIGILLEEKGKIPPLQQSLDFYVIDSEEGCMPAVLQIAAGLRQAGWRVDYGLKRQKTGKQIKEALKRGARAAVFVSRDTASVSPDGYIVNLKDLQTGTQHPTNFFVGEFLDRPELGNSRGIDQLLQGFNFGAL